MDRRAFLGALIGVAAAGAAGTALARRGPRPGVLRVGVMTNLTHAPLLAGLGSGRIAHALAPVRVEPVVFRAGPRVTEAMIGGAIDVGTAGPAAVVVHHARHARRGRGLRVLSGCSSGGASLVVAHRARVSRPDDLRGRRLAVTQLGTSQDVALRTFLRDHGLREVAAGGDVEVLAISASTILAQLRAGDLDGAWLAEPWATRVVREVGAIRLVDERALWPSRRFATALLAAPASRASEPAILALARALGEEVARAQRDPVTAREEAYAELRRRTGNPGKREDFDAAWSFVDFTIDPLAESVERFTAQAAALGFCPADGAAGLLPTT